MCENENPLKNAYLESEILREIFRATQGSRGRHEAQSRREDSCAVLAGAEGSGKGQARKHLKKEFCFAESVDKSSHTENHKLANFMSSRDIVTSSLKCLCKSQETEVPLTCAHFILFLVRICLLLGVKSERLWQCGLRCPLSQSYVNTTLHSAAFINACCQNP